METNYLDKIKGSLFGGAIGDALGYPIEFLSEDEIFAIYGSEGITSYELDIRAGKALVSDDTQMTLFTANGILVGKKERMLHNSDKPYHHFIADSYKEWLLTQEMTKTELDKKRQDGHMCTSWLCDIKELFNRRAPGCTCISAIKNERFGKAENPIDEPLNDSKGCGGIMRVAPLALIRNDFDIEYLDMEGAQIAALTHGHSLGYMSAAVLTHIISRIVYPNGRSLSLKEIVIEARDTVHKLFEIDEHINELDEIINKAIELSENNDLDINNIHRLGEGWVAEETLAIAIYCSLNYQNDFSKGIIAAVNHRGDSDSTGAVTGNILGALVGYEAIEDKWKEKIELKDVIEMMAVEFIIDGL